jgi:hypothetical protein
MINHRHYTSKVPSSVNTVLEKEANGRHGSSSPYMNDKRKLEWRNREIVGMVTVFRAFLVFVATVAVFGGTMRTMLPMSHPDEESIIRQFAATELTRGKQPLKGTEFEPLNVLLGVTTSREGLKKRIPAILKTWGSPSNLPEDVSLVFFVGEGVTPVDKNMNVFKESVIHHLPDTKDDEYPPVRKTIAIIHALNKLAAENDRKFSFRWIMRVDDDAYVNFDALRKTLNSYHPHAEHYYFGRPGRGSTQDRKIYEKFNFNSYCMGGLGDIFSPITLQELDKSIDKCAAKVRVEMPSEFWHSDVLVGYCTSEATAVECNQGMDPNDKAIARDTLFSHNYDYKTSTKSWVDTEKLTQTIILHPFKSEKDMVHEHERIQKALGRRTSQQSRRI